MVRSGLLVSKIFANGGEEIPMALFSTGFVCGMPDIFVPYVASDFYFFKSLVPGQLCCFDGDVVRERVEALETVEALALTGRVSLNQNTAIYGQTLTLAYGRVREKVVSVLLRTASALSAWPGFDGVLPLTHDDIAFLAGIERATTSRELKRLSREELIILGYRSVTVLPALRGAYGDMIEASLPFYGNLWGAPASASEQ